MTILTVVIGPDSLTAKSWTVNKSCLRPSTQQVIEENVASATSKVGIEKGRRTCT